MEPTKQTAQPNKHDALEAKLAEALCLPKNDVMIRKVGGPDGINVDLGQVKRGRVYCLGVEEAAHVMDSSPVEFEPVFKTDRTRIEAASKASRNTAQDKTRTTEKAGRSG